MIIIPELETVVLQPPRTGTTSLRDAVLDTFPQAFLLYRHMEADGIPFGYDHWRRVCQIRHPLSRLVSVYRYMKQPKVKQRTNEKWIKKVQSAADRTFEEWLTHESVFTTPGVPNHPEYRPRDCVVWQVPEQIKSQYLWAAGTTDFIMQEHIEQDAMRHLGVTVGHKNKSTPATDAITYSSAIHEHMAEHHKWDYEIYGETV